MRPPLDKGVLLVVYLSCNSQAEAWNRQVINIQKSLSANPLPVDITSYKHLFDTLSTARKASGIRSRGKSSAKRRQPSKVLPSCRFPPRPGRFRGISNPSPGSLRDRSLPLSKTAGLLPDSLPLSKTDGESSEPSPLSKTAGLPPGSRSSSRKPTGSLRGRSLSLENGRATSGFTSSLENRRAVSKTFSRANPVPNRIRVLPGRLQTPSKHFP